MAFRARIKKTFSRSSSGSGSLSEEGPNGIRYYQPGEKIPMKYKRPVDKAHKEQLEQWQWASAWKGNNEASHTVQQSPGGSRASSRRNSLVEPPMGDGLEPLSNFAKGQLQFL
jgi:hypothetical protein